MVQAVPAFGISPSEKQTLDLVRDHPMIPREHLTRWLGVSEGRVSEMMHSLVNTWGLVERRGKRGDTRYTLSAEGIRYVTHRDRAQLPTTMGIWSTALTTDREGRRRHLGPTRATTGRPSIKTTSRRSHHAVRRGQRRRRGNLRATCGSHDPHVTAYPRVLLARSVQHRDTGTVLASTVGAGVATTGPVRAERLPMGLTLSPDASSSCRGE